MPGDHPEIETGQASGGTVSRIHTVQISHKTVIVSINGSIL